MNLEDLLSEKSQTQKVTCCAISQIGNVQKTQIQRDRNQADGLQELAAGQLTS